MANLSDCTLIEIPKIQDHRGNLAVIENSILPFEMQRVYYLYNVPAGAYRGGHSHKAQSEFLIAISGSFEVIIDDGTNKKSILLNRPDKGLLIPPGIWRELQEFSQGSVCMVINSDVFSEEDYIRDYHQFISSSIK
jgi:dTDP-4-dehydrorhamnose 3,5-epimerase-like enzyme